MNTEGVFPSQVVCAIRDLAERIQLSVYGASLALTYALQEIQGDARP